MSAEDFATRYERTVDIVRAAQIPEALRASYLEILGRLRLVVDGGDPAPEAVELLQKIVLAVTLEAGKAKEPAGA